MINNNLNNNNNPKSVEKQLTELFIKYNINNKLKVSLVKKWIYKTHGKSMEDFNLLQKKFLSFFPAVNDIKAINEIMQSFTAAWNVFPHKSLHGKSPNEMVKKELEKSKQIDEKNDAKMPEMIVGGQTMQWDEYLRMIQEMERLQIPFKKWTDNEVLPKFKKYLQSLPSNNKQEQYYRVADIFFDRVRHIGFLDLDSIRKEFVQKEFPRWWQTHILGSNISEQQIRISLKKLFEFLELVYEIQPKKFGFLKDLKTKQQ